jgi:AcrR family transcriptional regulator
MLRPDSPRRRDIVTDFAIGLIAEEGLAALTVRGLARRIRVTPAGVQHWVGPRQQMLVAIAATFGQRWEQWMWRRAFRDGALAVLPLTADEVVWTRVWLALQELGRAEPEVGRVVDDVRGLEGDLISHHVGLAEDDLATVLALVDGLRVAVCRGDGFMDAESARNVLRRELAAWAARSDQASPIS